MSKKKRQSDAPAAGGSDSQERPAEKLNLRSDASEPVADRRPLPMPLIVLGVILFYLADMHLMANRGEFNPVVYEPYETVEEIEGQWPVDPAVESRKQGKRVYETVCAACHQGSGLGVAGQFPPLAGSDWVLAEGPDRIARLVLFGIQGPITVNGQNYNNAMPPWGPMLKDAEVAAVVNFIRSEWGNKASAITPETVAKIRAATPDRGPWAADELLKTPEK